MDSSAVIGRVVMAATLLVPVVYGVVYRGDPVRFGLRGVVLTVGCAAWAVVAVGSLTLLDLEMARDRFEAERARLVSEGHNVIRDELVEDWKRGEQGQAWRRVTFARPDGTTFTDGYRTQGVSLSVARGAAIGSLFYVAYCVIWRTVGRIAWRIGEWFRRRSSSEASAVSNAGEG